MNCIPGSGIQTLVRATVRARRRLVIALILACGGCALPVQAADRVYDAVFTITPDPDDGTAAVEFAVGQSRHLLREVSMRMPAGRFMAPEGDGEVSRDGDRVTWLVPREGGILRWTANLRHQRYDDGYDAWLGDDWALFRATDAIPPARTRTLKGARSRTELRFDLPDGWSSLTQYRGSNHRYPVTRADRRYDRPAGWILLGDIGVRIETIAGIRVLVGGPTGQDVRRLDMLALLHWTLPQLTQLLPGFPKRLTIISADDGMWEGGLSGPESLYVHADLPLLSENGTSALLHEVLHIGTGLSARAGADWIVEGLAEYYTIEILRRSRTISRKRYRDALEEQAEWGEDVSDLCEAESTGRQTARAVTLFAELAAELRANSSATNPLDDLLRNLVARDRKVTVRALRRIATEIHGKLPVTLQADSLPGCDEAGDE